MMKEVILTIGPMCSGKSTYCEKLLKVDPSLVLISRDSIYSEMFGGEWNSVSQIDRAWDKLWETVGEVLKRESVRILLDAWNSNPEARRSMTKELKGMGVERVTGWRFTTPESVCVQWFLESLAKGEARGLQSAYHYRERWLVYNSHPVTTSQGLDKIVSTDASQVSQEDVQLVYASLIC